MKKVLIVDDEPGILEFVSFSLQRLGLEVLQAVNGAEAIRQYVQHAPDCVLLDINLPDLHGDTVLTVIRELDAQAVIFFITGNVDYTDEQAFAAGAQGLFTKPVVIRDVYEQLQKRFVAEKDSVQECQSP